jgi:hypothetical protein
MSINGDSANASRSAPVDRRSKRSLAPGLGSYQSGFTFSCGPWPVRAHAQPAQISP